MTGSTEIPPPPTVLRSEMGSTHSLPRWLKPFNQVVMALNCLGLPMGTQHVLSIRGRKTGRWRSTPVSLLTVDGRRYVCTGLETDWVKNARAAGWGVLRRGRRMERVALIELPVEEREAILREFPRQVPHGVAYFERILGLPSDPAAFAAAAPFCPVFRFDPLPEEDRSGSEPGLPLADETPAEAPEG
jgi:hypothetical protein